MSVANKEGQLQTARNNWTEGREDEENSGGGGGTRAARARRADWRVSIPATPPSLPARWQPTKRQSQGKKNVWRRGISCTRGQLPTCRSVPSRQPPAAAKHTDGHRREHMGGSRARPLAATVGTVWVRSVLRLHPAQ